jgi:hypothetical protein
VLVTVWEVFYELIAVLIILNFVSEESVGDAVGTNHPVHHRLD